MHFWVTYNAAPANSYTYALALDLRVSEREATVLESSAQAAKSQYSDGHVPICHMDNSAPSSVQLTLPRLGGGLLESVQILHILRSARVTDTLNQTHCVKIILFVSSVFSDRIVSAKAGDMSLRRAATMPSPRRCLHIPGFACHW